jgi:dipeptidyl aminopeptidase/acylaminoacyl peptidase
MVKYLSARGTDDKNVSPESAVVLCPGLLSKGKNVNLMLVENANHSFKDVK